jgi:hypothetical protein
MLAKIGKDARLLALLFEALECALEVLVVMNDDFRQNLLPPFVAFVRRQLDRPLNLADLQWLYNPFSWECGFGTNGTETERPDRG